MRAGGHCPGCGGGEGNQSCKIARCSLEHGKVEYCFQCGCYPCGKYEKIDEFDSFITHQRQKADLERAERMGLARYSAEQAEKAEILAVLLSQYNDGRRKTLFCTAVNLLELEKLREIMQDLQDNTAAGCSVTKEKSVYAAKLFQTAAEERGVTLSLRKKK